MKEITIDTVQGIGDLVWVYRKLAPLYDRINLNVLVIKEDTVQMRAKDFLSTLDKVGTVTFKVVTPEEYGRVARGLYTVDEAAASGEYCVNAWLERGIHLDAIDESPVLWDVNLKHQPVDGVPKDYFLLYVSGTSHNFKFYQMRSAMWAELAIKISRLLRVQDCLLVGAPYDKAKLTEIKTLIGNRLKARVMAETNIQQATSLIAGAQYFMAYQSGLCIIAEEVGTPTLMVYYPENAAMAAAWIRRENLLRGLIKNVMFGVPPSTIVEMARQHIAHLAAAPLVRKQLVVA